MTFNSSQQERLLTALERIADALEARGHEAVRLDGRCGVLAPESPGSTAVSCDLRAGHNGQHEGRTYPYGVLSHGHPMHWDAPTDPQTTKGPYR